MADVSQSQIKDVTDIPRVQENCEPLNVTGRSNQAQISLRFSQIDCFRDLDFDSIDFLSDFVLILAF